MSLGNTVLQLFCCFYSWCLYIIIIIIIIIIITIIISFMQGIYTHIPETNCVRREYGVAAILLFLFMVLILLLLLLLFTESRILYRVGTGRLGYRQLFR